MTTKHLISRAEFARRANRGRSTITEACRGPLARAIVRKRIDAAHPDVIAWARERGIDPDALTSQRRAARPSGAGSSPAPAATEPTTAPPAHGFGGPLTAIPDDLVIPEWASGASPAVILGALQAGLDAEIDRAKEQGQRLLQFEADLFDLDHPAVRRFLEQELDVTMTPELLAELWEEHEEHRQRRRELTDTPAAEAS
ncbi:MAG: hypothetical protein SangKO_086890 [Sandaracinaceae bacterium]